MPEATSLPLFLFLIRAKRKKSLEEFVSMQLKTGPANFFAEKMIQLIIHLIQRASRILIGRATHIRTYVRTHVQLAPRNTSALSQIPLSIQVESYGMHARQIPTLAFLLDLSTVSANSTV